MGYGETGALEAGTIGGAVPWLGLQPTARALPLPPAILKCALPRFSDLSARPGTDRFDPVSVFDDPNIDRSEYPEDLLDLSNPAVMLKVVRLAVVHVE